MRHGIRFGVACCVALVGATAGVAAASDDPVVNAVASTEEGGAGLGAVVQVRQSMYRGDGSRSDLIPLYLYEGKRFFLQGERFGLKLHDSSDQRTDLFAGYRFEGLPYDQIPASVLGLENRGTGVVVGLSHQRRNAWGTVFGEALHDVAGGSDGNEVRFGYRYDGSIGRLELKPQIVMAWRDARLNNYYYGVRPHEATASRPAYEPGSGVNTELGLSATYRVSERWRVVAGLTATRWASAVRASPIVDDRTQVTARAGLAYDFTPHHEAWPDGRPLIVKVLYGKSTDCDVAQVMRLACASTNTIDQSRIAAIELGRPFIERLNGLPVDFVGYVSALRHYERGLQDDSWQLSAYMKGYYYGFPWSDRIRTRLGIGVGISYAQRVPFVEIRDQTSRGRSSSKVLNYLDPTVDFSLGDLIGVKSMRETYLGLGVSHRSGIFGSSRLLGNVNGGSNYIYSYLEWKV